MQVNGGFNYGFEPSPPQSDEYDSVMAPQFQKPPLGHAVTMNGLYDAYNKEEEEDDDDGLLSKNSQLFLNTNGKPQGHDPIGQHMLYETALVDSQGYQILTIDEVDNLRKEEARLKSKIDATQRKLALETKVRNAARNIALLYTSHRRSRPDTPQSPNKGWQHGRSSSRDSAASDDSFPRPDDELAVSEKKVDDLAEILKSLTDRRQDIERKLLMHTAAVLALQTRIANEQTSTVANGHADEDDDHNSADEFDSIRDILLGHEAGTLKSLRKRAAAAHLQKEHDRSLSDMTRRITELNVQLSSGPNGSHYLATQSHLHDRSFEGPENPATAIHQSISELEHNLQILQQHQMDLLDAEGQLSQLCTQVHDVMVKHQLEAISTLGEPPEGIGHGLQAHVAYLHEGLAAIDEVEGDSKPGTKKLLAEYENTVIDLWKVMQADVDRGRTDLDSRPDQSRSRSNSVMNRSNSIKLARSKSLKETFSLSGFSTKVHLLISRANGAREQHEILRRQVQQQRELNGKSDAEKDRQIAELSDQHQALNDEHRDLREELSRIRAEHTDSATLAVDMREKMAGVEQELEEMRETAKSKKIERAELVRYLNQAKAHIQELETQITPQLARLEEEAAKSKNMEEKVVTLTTELAMAKAELEGAYGSRAERAKEAQSQLMNEIDALRGQHDNKLAELALASERVTALERELVDMMNEFQDLTRESVEQEREREQLENVIDGLRERCDTLESQLDDERLHRMASSPHPAVESPGFREMTSTMVLRQEFKKMMRDTRTEGIKLFRAEQLERRKLESEIRRLRNTPSRSRKGSMAGSDSPAITAHASPAVG